MSDSQEKIQKHIKENKTDVLGAFLLMAVGVIFLLNNFGVVPWNVWGYLWRFWPILLIIAAFQILIGRGNLLEFIVWVIGIALIIFAIVFSVSLVDKDFNLWVGRQYPNWPEIQKRIPIEYHEQKGFKWNK